MNFFKRRMAASDLFGKHLPYIRARTDKIIGQLFVTHQHKRPTIEEYSIEECSVSKTVSGD